MNELQNIFLKEKTTAVENLHYSMAYIENETGVCAREINIDSKKGDEKLVTIAMITDAHLNAEKTEHTKALVQTMKFASFADQTVLCGDNVESVSSDANIALLRENVWDVYPETITMLGNHEYFYPFDSSTDALKEKINSIWPHNPDYYSKLVGDKVLVVTADNARAVEYGNWQYYFTKEKCDFLKADIEYARKNGYIILFFCHVGLTLLDKNLEANSEMYKLITTNADVIKGCFSGHGHEDGKAQLCASDSGISVSIPQFFLCGCCEEKGHILFINVK